MIDNRETVVDWTAVSADAGAGPARQARPRTYLLLAGITVALVLALLVAAVVLQSTGGSAS
jgi:hypothetical protein